ncbi:hypothetical protein DPMN_135722 [Dreissena polymorpha]|uniref:Uncharacterized protein n=1 Tax=Dreissena polymorpha TaxID=45954 RepID=A0A9D4FYN5_DREPO|nr:hypothetical protein DPMN_135722 [Dreissena polymorpha]
MRVLSPHWPNGYGCCLLWSYYGYWTVECPLEGTRLSVRAESQGRWMLGTDDWVFSGVIL